jgi:hypothetical protein
MTKQIEYSRQFVECVSFVEALANGKKCRFQTTWFPSGCIMIDIWHDKDVFVIQLEIDNQKEYYGLSKLKDNESDFSTRADKYYNSVEEFKNVLNSWFN